MRRPHFHWTQPKIDEIGVDDVGDNWSEPFVLAPGHRHRGQLCAVCRKTIGGAVIRTITITDFRFGPCNCGAIPTACYLVHADHDVKAEPDPVVALHGRWLAHHGVKP